MTLSNSRLRSSGAALLLAAAGALAATQAACSSSRYGELLPERVHPRWSKVATERESAPRTIALIPTRGEGGADEEILVAVHRPRELDSSLAIVLVHGALSDHRTFRYLVPQLEGEADVLAIDLPGCGKSTGWRARRGVCSGFTPDEIAERLMQALASIERELPSETRLVLVGHSYGGAIALRCYAPALRQRYAQVHARTLGLALIAPYDPSSGYIIPELAEIATATPFEILLAQISGWLRDGASEAVWYGTAEPGALPREEADRIIEILSRGDLRRAAQSMLRRAAPWDPRGELDPARSRAIARELASVDLPCLVLWGDQDDTLPPEHGHSLCAKLPHASFESMARCKHSPHLERPEACARAILRFASKLNRGELRAAELPAN